MLTSRGWWFLVFLVALFAGEAVAQPLLNLFVPRLEIQLASRETGELLALTLGLWLAWRWVRFSFATTSLVRRLVVERQLYDERGPVDTLWAGRTFRVQVRVTLPAGDRVPFVVLTDRVPFGVDFGTGETHYEGTIEPEQP